MGQYVQESLGKWSTEEQAATFCRPHCNQRLRQHSWPLFTLADGGKPQQQQEQTSTAFLLQAGAAAWAGPGHQGHQRRHTTFTKVIAEPTHATHSPNNTW